MTTEPTWKLRIAVAERLIAWGMVPVMPPLIMVGDGGPDDTAYLHLAWLLGYADGVDLMANFRAADRLKLELLLGPYGLTIYKIMVLQRGYDENMCEMQTQKD